MILRQYQNGNVASEAIYSPCEAYRYVLTRRWQANEPELAIVMLNPSTATEAQNDPTIERCERRARRLGFGGLRVVNLFAYRATDPQVMKAAADPIGPDNDRILRELLATRPTMLLCAWGTHGAHLGRGNAVSKMLRQNAAPLWHLGLTLGGHPKHPLYIRYDLEPQLWA